MCFLRFYEIYGNGNYKIDLATTFFRICSLHTHNFGITEEEDRPVGCSGRKIRGFFWWVDWIPTGSAADEECPGERD